MLDEFFTTSTHHSLQPAAAPLTASRYASTQAPLAYEAAAFFQQQTHSSWKGRTAWYKSNTRFPDELAKRADHHRSSSLRSTGTHTNIIGLIAFFDLSLLYYSVQCNSYDTTPASVDIALRPPPEPLGAEQLFLDSSKYGNLVAAFAEEAARSGRPVGDGECWTLAKAALDSVNQVVKAGQADTSDTLFETLGRTHGHLIYAADASQEQGTWRGGDRGGIRRGDIIEWQQARCSTYGAPPGTYSTLGAPDHTAVIIADCAAPSWLAQSAQAFPLIAPGDIPYVTVIEQSAGQVPTQATYDLSTFTHGKLWIYRPVSDRAYMGGPRNVEWPPTLPGFEVIHC